MITFDNIGFEFSGRWLFRNTTLQIKPGDRIGLVGRNGTGKSTLIKLLTGELHPVEGQVSMMKGVRIGCLEQEMQSLHSNRTVLDVAMEAFAEAIALRQEIEALLQDPRINTDEKLIQELTNKQMRLESLDGYNLESKAAAILAGLGFSEADQNSPFDTFSGGWRMRVHLARLLLQQPDLLLLDEPTNHLDLPSILWLEDYLRNFAGAFVIVSHDRFFLDRLITSTVELARQRFNRYKGNYSYYLKEKELRSEQHVREYENQQKFILDTERFIQRFRAKATKAKQVQSKIKMLERLERIDPPENDAATVNFTFKPDVQPGKTIAQLKVQQKAYGEKVIVKGCEQAMRRGDKIALVGANGLGKSTVLRMIAGTEPFAGDRSLGHNVHPSFFAQHQLDALSGEDDILEEMRPFVYKRGEAFVRGVLGGFLFTGDDVFKKIKVLSGGEKSRVALAKTLLSEANFLLLDEPTNHLDIQSIQILCQALADYEGSFIVVSHDRYFLREVANKVWYIEDKELKVYPGTYVEFEYHQAQKEGRAPKAAVAFTNGQTSSKDKKKGKNAYLEDKERRKKERKLKNRLNRIEGEIMALEEKKSALVGDMAKPEMASSFDKLAELQRKVDKIDRSLEPLQSDWELVLQEIEEAGIEV
ncbi:MAG: ABC-F family ATP-binding cassette domain-containing protein [Bacteroidota bacterium]